MSADFSVEVGVDWSDWFGRVVEDYVELGRDMGLTDAEVVVVLEGVVSRLRGGDGDAVQGQG